MLDSGPLGMVTNPKTTSAVCQECKLWLDSLPEKGYQVVLPEIADYEVRRELRRAGSREQGAESREQGAGSREQGA